MRGSCVTQSSDARHLGANDMLDDRLTSQPAPSHILLVEDDPEISRLLADVLTENGFAATFAASSRSMDLHLDKGGVDLVVLDVMLPGENGFSICRRLRAASNIPIIMLTALGEEVDRIVGLEIGADDYITKPFSSRELVARIRALLRRAQGDQPRSARLAKTFHFAGWRLEASSRQLFNPDGVRISLTSAELDLLAAFCRNPGRILSRDQLLELTHSGLAGPIVRSIDVHVSRIRQKIELNPQEAILIKTVRLGGYVFTPNVEAS
jgi:two-component system OmpR family response regulator